MIRATICLSVLVTFAAPSVGVGQGLHGVVVDSAGNPLGGVKIADLTQIGLSTETLSDGSFHLKSAKGPVLIETRAHAPLLVLPSGKPEPVRLILKDRASEEWRIPRCAGAKDDGGPFRTLQLGSSHGLKRETGGPDPGDFNLVRFTDRASGSQMQLWKRTVSSGLPSSVWLDDLTTVSVQPVNLDGVLCHDITGATKMNRRFRWVGCFYTLVVYSDADPQVAAKKFDRMIDRMCYR